ncbi:MAG TPA: C40 family peptidase [Pedobacter sp.]|uniref:C40 family peptidase n=1 Tax=Pedobacter sp. TaxID=1411316 RepID=UPI002C15B686|nr:C40 family peptidase [Pedobacter sp.]HMI00927.1 C40 family peptidase [Pedobacter sp.]
MEQHYAICRVAVAPLRAEPSDKAEISSQLLFGDHVEILQKTERWWQVRNGYDDYQGWMDFRQLAGLTREQFAASQYNQYLVPPAPVNIAVDSDGGKYYLSPASILPLYDKGFCYLGEAKYEVLFEPRHVVAEDPENIIKDALFFENVSYLWGGRNFFGLDCSGFVQTVFKLNGFSLKRDAWQQAEQGTTVDFLQEVQPGDVAFFDNAEGRITHVGIMLSPTEIIHSSGRVHIDPIDNQGIYNPELGRYTHKLRIIKRYS